MKKYGFVFLVLILVSCKGSYVKEVRNFQGDWQIQSISYFDGRQISTKTGNLGQMVFGTEKPNSVAGVNIGKQTVGKWVADFQYSFSFSGQLVDISLSMTDRKTIPPDAIGRVQVYNYETVDNNTLRLYADKEFDYSTNQLITNVSYVLKR